MRRTRISRRTEHLSWSGRMLYRIEHYSSLPNLAVAIPILLAGFLIAGVLLGFPTGWVAAFEVSTSAVTLVMVFAIQHTQAREQAATQRKLDELIRATPGAAESLMMLEEAPEQVIFEIGEDQRAKRDESEDAHSHRS